MPDASTRLAAVGRGVHPALAALASVGVDMGMGMAGGDSAQMCAMHRQMMAGRGIRTTRSGALLPRYLYPEPPGLATVFFGTRPREG